MRVLNFVTHERARFFDQQVRALEADGVETAIVSVPGEVEMDDDTKEGRSLTDYLRFFGPAVAETFGDYDLVHANNGLTAPPAVVQPNLPVVISLWGTDLMGPYGWLSRLCARRADAVVVMSPEMAEILDAPCHVIPHGVDLDRFVPEPPAEARADLGWDEDARHVLFPYAKMREVKDYPRAARIVDAAREELDRPVELHTVNGVPHARMPTYMNAADALLLTSKREGSPNAVKEAMACNTPVVSTDVGDVRDRLAGVDRSFVCTSDRDLTAALVEVLAAGQRSNGRAAAREVSVARTSARLQDVYRSVLGADADVEPVAPADGPA